MTQPLSNLQWNKIYLSFFLLQTMSTPVSTPVNSPVKLVRSASEPPHTSSLQTRISFDARSGQIQLQKQASTTGISYNTGTRDVTSL